jgi:hypothetical protein
MEHLGDWTRALLEQEGRDAGRSGHGPGAAAGGRAVGLGKAALEELVRRLAPRFQLPMPLGPALREDQRRIVELTEQQFRVLNQLARNRRVVISGGAGSRRSAWRPPAGGLREEEPAVSRRFRHRPGSSLGLTGGPTR